MIAVACTGVFLLAGSVWVFEEASHAVPQAEKHQVHRAIEADIDYRNARVLTPAAGARPPEAPFPTLVTAAEKTALKKLPPGAAHSERFTGFSTTIAITSFTVKGQLGLAEFSEITLMSRPKPLPEYGYATPQVAVLTKIHGAWMVDSIHFAPGSGMDGATCSPHRWAGDC